MQDLMKIPPRLPDWRARLGQYLAEVAKERFLPGRHDCTLFAAGAVQAMTGFDPAADWRGTYRTLAAGRKALKAAGYKDHQALAAAYCEEVAPALASVGDLAAMPGANGTAALGIIQGAGVYVLLPSGLALASRLHMKKAFRI